MAWGWLGPLLVILLVLLFAALLFVMWRSTLGTGHQQQRPEAALRERYARGELTAQHYREALLNVLKDRYVRDEIDLEEYEARMALLLGGERTSHALADSERVGARARDGA